MYKLLFTSLILFGFLGSFGQVGKVRDQINNSFSCVKKSWTAADKALGEIQKCNIANSVNEIQNIAARAKSEMEEAMTQAEEAESNADGAEGEALNIGCTVAEKGIAKAEKYLKKAKERFDDAVTKLNNATDEDRADYLIEYLNSTISGIDQGMGYLKKGTDELNGALKELNGCR